MTVLVPATGIYRDLTADLYHADASLAPELGRSLSSTGARSILRSPARFAYEREYPVTSDVFDLGGTAHELVLRTGDSLHVVDAYDWRGRADQATKKRLRAEGIRVVHRGEYRDAALMAQAVRRHPLAAAILAEGEPEVSLYWTEPGSGVTCRGRLDWLRGNAICDLKTAADASPWGWGKAAYDHGLHIQAAMYQAGYEALTGERLPFIHLVVEKTRPHLVAVHQLDDDALALGREQYQRACQTFAECESSGVWPGYPTDSISTVQLPAYAYRSAAA